MASSIADVLKALSIERESARSAQGILTGLPSLDEILGGLRGGALYVVAGRPSMGKTSFLLRLVEHTALRQRKSVLLFAPERSAAESVRDLLYAKARVDRFSPQGPLAEAERRRILLAADEFRDVAVSIDDTADITLLDLSGRVRDSHADLVLVDGAHLVRLEPAWPSPSGRLKTLARELGIPIVIAAPVHRRAEDRARMRPLLGDVYGVGNAETDADVVLLLWREAYYDPKAALNGMCEIIVAKNRFGSSGATKVLFQAGYGTMH